MGIKNRLPVLFSLIALICTGILINEFLFWNETRLYNTEIENENFAEAGFYRKDYGLFSKAYAEQQTGNYQKARIVYISLATTDNRELRLMSMFNLANTFLQQALEFDLDKDADQAIPLIELAKSSYRDLLSIDSQYWNAKYNLERALKILPDTGERVFMKRTSSRSLQQKEISSDIKSGLP